MRKQVAESRVGPLGFIILPLRAALRSVQREIVEAGWSDSSALRYAAWVSVWWRWASWLMVITEAAYRPELQGGTYLPFVVLHLFYVSGNGLVHYRLASGRSVSWAAVLALSAMDFVLVTSAVVSDGGFNNFYYLGYYPSLALVAVACPSFVVGILWATVTAAVYGTLSLFVGSGLDLRANEEEELVFRLFCMYVVMLGVNLVAWRERARRQDSEERQRALLEQGLEMSQVIHDTVAQTAYTMRLGVDTARRLAGDSNEELSSSLAALSALSRSIVWELRRPIDTGLVFEGTDLTETLRVHTETFGRVASVSAEVVQLGDEPPLPVEVRVGLFSVAHNALTNALMHSEADEVKVILDFGDEWIRLSITDNGVGLPEGYARRGRGFSGMEADAARMDGRLVAGSAGPDGGTTVTCQVPRPRGAVGG